MPVSCRVINDKWRIVEPSGGIAKTKKGNPIDGGGHPSKVACNRQARAINRSINESNSEQSRELTIKPQNRFLSKLVNRATNVVTASSRAMVEFQERIKTLAEHDSKRIQQFAYYDAAKYNKQNKDWRPGLSSADQAILDDLDTLMARSRSMLRNDGISASGRGAFLRYVVGSGITARSAARHPVTGEMLDTYNKALDRLWNEWANNPNLCDLEKTKTLVEKEALWLSEQYSVGGIFIVLDYMPNNEGVGLILQEVEYEQVDATIMSYGEREVKGGIEVDDYGAPIAYHLYVTSHPSEQYKSDSGRIPAERVIHLFRQDRVRQKKGTPWTAAVMSSIHNLAIYEQSMLMKARTEAAYHGIVEQDSASGFGLPDTVARQIGAVPRTDDTSSDTAANSLEVIIQPGLMPILNPGQHIKFPTPATPNTMYQPFVWEQLKRISAGIGLDQATVARWYAEGNFSSQRQAKLDIYAETDPIQAIMINKVLRRIRNLFIKLAIKESLLSATGYLQSERWRAAYQTTNWQGPAKTSIDDFKDAVAAEKLINKGLLSRQRYFNSRNMEIRDIYAEIEEDRILQKKHGLDFDSVPKPIGSDETPNPRGKQGSNGGASRINNRMLIGPGI